METFREIYWESLRAPSDNATFTRNPYRREKILKKLYGRTKEEREKAKESMELELAEHIKT